MSCDWRKIVPNVTHIAVTGDTTYDVVVGHGLDSELASLIGSSTSRVALIHPATRPGDARRLATVVRSTGAEPVLIAVPDSEAAKTADVLTDCWTALGRAGFTRSDAVIGIGGGATTDLAGFVAASWLRGIRLIHVPTTLLGMVDAAVGGKTGINTSEGKNLVGAFYAPAGVLCDLDALSTLPKVDLVAGMAEIVKVGFTTDTAILDIVEADPVAALDVHSGPLRELVERAIRVKASVVSEDLREARPGGLGREVLNYGHTFAHAIELVERYTWRHGHAVSVGLAFIASLGRLSGRLSDADAARHRAVLTALGLPITYASGRFPELLDAMRIDKKSRGDLLRFVILDGIGRPGLLEGPDIALLEAAYAEVSEVSP
ncbi:MAG: 3-dehydroquinate synthase [Actinobacteria bacterium]|nr:3-dehydroquinate synthase [Actinomycetota bacterium]MSW37047.1 3-dehydroquinate synthase [Actinomycetota bacterium]